MSNFRGEGEVLNGTLKHAWDKAPGAPPVHRFDERGVQPANQAGGEISPTAYPSSGHADKVLGERKPPKP